MTDDTPTDSTPTDSTPTDSTPTENVPPPTPGPVDEPGATQPVSVPVPDEPVPTEPPPTEVIEPVAAEQPRTDPAVMGLAAATAALLIATILLAWMVFAPATAPLKLGATRTAAEGQARNEITDTAERVAESFLTIDYRTLDADFRRISKDATSGFQDRLEQVIEMQRKGFKKQKTVYKGNVTDSLILKSDDEAATVRVVVERSITDADHKKAEKGVQVLDVQLVDVDGTWKVEEISQLGDGGQQ